MDTPQQSTTSPIFQHILRLGEIFSATWALYSKHFALIVIITLVVAIPVNIGNTLITDMSTDLSTSAITDDGYGVFSGIMWINLLGGGILLALVGVLTPLAISFAVNKLVKGESVTYQEALKAAFSAWPRGIITSLILFVLLVVLYTLLIIPGIIFTIFWAFAIPAVMISGLSGMSALSDSKSIVSGRWWKVFGNLLVIGILVGIIGAIISSPFSGSSSWVMRVIALTISSIVTAFINVAMVVMYINLKKFPATSVSAPVAPAPSPEQK